MSDDQRNDVPRDPWGNPMPPEDRPPSQPRPDDFPPPFPGGDVARRPAPDPDANPAWPGAPEASPGQGAPPSPYDPRWGQPPHGGHPSPPGVFDPGPSGYGTPGAAPGWGPPPWAQPRTDGKAIGALVCAIVGLLVCGVILEPLAIGLGLAARKSIRQSGGLLKGDGMATAAIVIGIIGLVLSVVMLFVLMANPDLLDNMFQVDTNSN